MISKLKKFIYICKNFGWHIGIFLGLRKIVGIYFYQVSTALEFKRLLRWQINPVILKNHLLYRQENPTHNKKLRSIHWVLPLGKVGSGGHQTAARMILYLMQQGYEVTVWLTEYEPPQFIESFRVTYGLQNCAIKILEHPQLIEADVLIATDRSTVFPVAMAEKVLRKFYFIQDYEPLFYTAGSVSVVVDYTYQLGLIPITAGVWLKQFLKYHHGLAAESFDLACDQRIYNHKGKIEPKQKTVIFYARNTTARRCVELGLLALEILKREMPEVHIILFGLGKKVKLPFEAEIYGIIPPEKIAQLYLRSSVGLSLSATNYSLIPNEMMACGLPVVELDLPNNRAVYPQGTVTYAAPYPAEIAATLKALLLDDHLRAQRVQKSLQYVKKLSWEKSAQQVEQIIVKNFKKQVTKTNNKKVNFEK